MWHRAASTVDRGDVSGVRRWEVSDLPRVLTAYGMHRVVVVTPPDAFPALGGLVGMLGSRVAALCDRVPESPSPADVFALADVVHSAGADGVVAFGPAGSARLATALAAVLPVPAAVVGDRGGEAEALWMGEHPRAGERPGPVAGLSGSRVVPAGGAGTGSGRYRPERRALSGAVVRTVFAVTRLHETSDGCGA